MSIIYGVSMMIYGSLQSEWMGTKRNSCFHRYGAPIFVTLLFLYLNRIAMIITYFEGCKIWFDSICLVFFLDRKHDFCCNLLHSLHHPFLHGSAISRCNKEHTTGLKWRGSKSTYVADNIHIFKIHENKKSDKENPANCYLNRTQT